MVKEGKQVKLNYESTGQLPWHQARVLIKAELRIELVVKRLNTTRFVLVALSGKSGAQPWRHKCQGPYFSSQQAMAAQSAIVHACMQDGFIWQKQQPAYWQLHAQALTRELQASNTEGSTDFSFDPADVFFNTLSSQPESDEPAST